MIQTTIITYENVLQQNSNDTKHNYHLRERIATEKQRYNAQLPLTRKHCNRKAKIQTTIINYENVL